MGKTWKRGIALASILAFTAALGLAGCNKQGQTDETTTQAAQESASADPYQVEAKTPDEALEAYLRCLQDGQTQIANGYEWIPTQSQSADLGTASSQSGPGAETAKFMANFTQLGYDGIESYAIEKVGENSQRTLYLVDLTFNAPNAAQSDLNAPEPTESSEEGESTEAGTATTNAEAATAAETTAETATVTESATESASETAAESESESPQPSAAAASDDYVVDGDVAYNVWEADVYDDGEQREAQEAFAAAQAAAQEGEAEAPEDGQPETASAAEVPTTSQEELEAALDVDDSAEGQTTEETIDVAAEEISAAEAESSTEIEVYGAGKEQVLMTVVQSDGKYYVAPNNLLAVYQLAMDAPATEADEAADFAVEQLELRIASAQAGESTADATDTEKATNIEAYRAERVALVQGVFPRLKELRRYSTALEFDLEVENDGEQTFSLGSDDEPAILSVTGMAVQVDALAGVDDVELWGLSRLTAEDGVYYGPFTTFVEPFEVPTDEIVSIGTARVEGNIDWLSSISFVLSDGSHVAVDISDMVGGNGAARNIFEQVDILEEAAASEDNDNEGNPRMDTGTGTIVGTEFDLDTQSSAVTDSAAATDTAQSTEATASSDVSAAGSGAAETASEAPVAETAETAAAEAATEQATQAAEVPAENNGSNDPPVIKIN